jgi:hypothetical protein
LKVLKNLGPDIKVERILGGLVEEEGAFDEFWYSIINIVLPITGDIVPGRRGYVGTTALCIEVSNNSGIA